jgi:hypothetical protein
MRLAIWVLLAACWSGGGAPALGAQSGPPAVAVPSLRNQEHRQPPASVEFQGGLDILAYPAEGKLEPAVEMMLSGPPGKMGRDPQTGQNFPGTPGSYYEREGLEDAETGDPGPETAVLYLHNAPAGKYTLKVFGVTRGAYSLDIRGFDAEYHASKVAFNDISVTPGAVHTYAIDYSQEKGVNLKADRIR